jgi:hypothetical protein
LIVSVYCQKNRRPKTEKIQKIVSKTLFFPQAIQKPHFSYFDYKTNLLHFLLPDAPTFVSNKEIEKKMNKHSLSLFLAICWLTALNTSSAQSFLKFYTPPSNLNLEAQSVFVYPNGDYGIAARGSINAGGTNNTLALLHTDANGAQISFTGQIMPENTPHFLELDGSVVTAVQSVDSLVLWKRNPAQDTVWRTAVKLASANLNIRIYKVEENGAGEIFVNGVYYLAGPNNFYYFTTKFAADGTFLWKNTVTTNDYQFPYGAAPDALGGCLSGWPIIDTVASPNSFYSLLTRYLPDGTVAWHNKTYPGLGLSSIGYGTNDAGQSLLVQSEFGQNNDTSWLLLLGPAGDTVWHRYLNNVPDMCQLKASLVLPIANNGFYVLGINYLDNLNQTNATVAKVNADGSIAWSRTFPNLLLGRIDFTAGSVLSDGTLVAAGTRIDNKLVVLKITSDGNLDSYQNAIEGKVVLDNNDNCVVENGESPLQNWVVTAKGPELTLFSVTDAVGHYRIPFIDTGAYQVFLAPPSYLWQPCSDTITIFFPSGGQPATDTADFAIQTPIDCPLLQVDVSAPNFRRCTAITASAQICNWGITTAVPAELRIVPDPQITLSNFSYPHTLEGDTIVFTFDSLPALDCRVVTMTALVDCNASLGQTLCIEAAALPDAICLPANGNWSGASIEVAGFCDGDSVRLQLSNKGIAATSQPVDYVIIDDHVITRQGATHLLAGETKVISEPANGHTWRLSATQEPGHPVSEQDATVAVEGCTTTGNSTTGMLNLFANHSGNGSSDIFCKEVIGSYDPNDKTGFPYGVDEPHCIEAEQEMEYLIRFQNTGNDTAFRVEIRDTLSAWLQPGSIRPGTSSHPYTWTLSGTGILSVLFDNIMLPDSNVNEPASNGFVTFRIAQKAENPVGAVIFNQAAIFFDLNEAVLTNTTYQTVCKDFLEINLVATASPAPGKPRILVMPNPASDFVRLSLPENTLHNGEFVLRDALGREIRRASFNGTSAEIQREGLSSGIYFVEILENGVRAGVEKVIWR